MGSDSKHLCLADCVLCDEQMAGELRLSCEYRDIPFSTSSHSRIDNCTIYCQLPIH